MSGKISAAFDVESLQFIESNMLSLQFIEFNKTQDKHLYLEAEVVGRFLVNNLMTSATTLIVQTR